MNFSNHMTSSSTISMSETVFKKLPKEYQQALLSAAAEAAKFNHGLTISRDTEYREKLGKTLKAVQPDVESFKKAVRYDQIDLVSSDKSKELIKKLATIK